MLIVDNLWRMEQCTHVVAGYRSTASVATKFPIVFPGWWFLPPKRKHTQQTLEVHLTLLAGCVVTVCRSNIVAVIVRFPAGVECVSDPAPRARESGESSLDTVEAFGRGRGGVFYLHVYTVQMLGG